MHFVSTSQLVLLGTRRSNLNVEQIAVLNTLDTSQKRSSPSCTAPPMNFELWYGNTSVTPDSDLGILPATRRMP